VTTVIGPMLERGSGTILFTTAGAALNPNPARTGVGISFAGEIAYARMLHDELLAQLVRLLLVAHPGSAPLSLSGDTAPVVVSGDAVALVGVDAQRRKCPA
jgi:hypothetical protein